MFLLTCICFYSNCLSYLSVLEHAQSRTFFLLCVCRAPSTVKCHFHLSPLDFVILQVVGLAVNNRKLCCFTHSIRQISSLKAGVEPVIDLQRYEFESMLSILYLMSLAPGSWLWFIFITKPFFFLPLHQTRLPGLVSIIHIIVHVLFCFNFISKRY